MGTSTGYEAPPSWGDLKNEVTRAAKAGTVPPSKIRRILQNYIHENGGARQIARGTGGGGGSRVGSGEAARAVAERLGSFISNVGAFGLDEALRRADLADLVGQPVQSILNGILDRVGGSATTLDDTDARAALSRLQDQLLGGAEDAAAVEQILSNSAPDIELLLQDFFVFYLYEQFCRVFFERLSQRVGELTAQSFLKQIEDFIRSALANRTSGRNIRQIDWSQEGRALVMDILETTLKVFGG